MVELVVDLEGEVRRRPVVRRHGVLGRHELVDVDAVVALALEQLELKFGLTRLFVDLELMLRGNNLCAADLLFLVQMIPIYLAQSVEGYSTFRKLPVESSDSFDQ